MEKMKLSTANLIIVIGGVVILIASFLAFHKISIAGGSVDFSGGTIKVRTFSKSYSAWSNGSFLIATIPALLGVLMAAQVAVATFASGVKLPEQVLGFTWTQIHMVLAAQATLMMLAFLVQDAGDKGVGLFLMLLAAIALLVGAILRTRETPGAAIPPPSAT